MAVGSFLHINGRFRDTGQAKGNSMLPLPQLCAAIVKVTWRDKQTREKKTMGNQRDTQIHMSWGLLFCIIDLHT